MKPLQIVFLFAIVFILHLFSAQAAVDVTYEFNVNEVNALAYDCLDAPCNSVGAFDGSFPQGAATSNGRIVVRYPDSLSSPFGYAMFFTSSGYLPKEGIATFHTFGESGVAKTSIQLELEKKAVCSATIDKFQVLNSVEENVPVAFRTKASLDADTHSAFQLSDTGVGFIPSELKNEFYSVDTMVSLLIYDDENKLIEKFAKEFTASNGNPFFADSKKNVEFSWIPHKSGKFSAEMRTDVVDSQCSTANAQFAKKEFNVYPEKPRNACYVILNNLKTDNAHPETGSDVRVTYSRIGSRAGSSGELSAVKTSVAETVYGPDGKVLFARTRVLDRNKNPDEFSTHAFSFTPEKQGSHRIVVEAEGYEAECRGKTSTKEKISEIIYVNGKELYEVEFQVRSSDGKPVSGAEVFIGNDSGATNSKGKYAAKYLLPEKYSYSIMHSQFDGSSGYVEIKDNDRVVFITLDTRNSAPIILGLPDIVMPKNTVNKDINLNYYVMDDNHAKDEIAWTVSGNAMIEVIIGSDNKVSLVPKKEFTGIEHIIFRAEDPKGEAGIGIMKVTVTDSNTPPKFHSLPIISLEEDSHLFDALYLPDYAFDAETDSTLLEYKIISVSDTKSGVSIDSSLFVDINPAQEFDKPVSVIFEVSDGEFKDNAVLKMDFNSVNDAPVLFSFPDIITNIYEPKSLDLSKFADDPDDDAGLLSFSAFGHDAGIADVYVEGHKLIVIPKAEGSTHATIKVADPHGLSASRSVYIIVTSGTLPKCSDGKDNDKDGYVDLQDPGCSKSGDDDESDSFTAPEQKGKIFISQVRIPDAYAAVPGARIPVFVDLMNEGFAGLKSVKGTVVIQELGIRGSFGPVSVDEGHGKSGLMLIEIPENADYGAYGVRITITADGLRRVIYRELEILK